MHFPAILQPYSEAEAWLQQAEFLILHGQYAPAKVPAPLRAPLLPLTLNELPLDAIIHEDGREYCCSVDTGISTHPLHSLH